MSTPSTPIRVSAKFLAGMAMPTFCPCCYWYRLHCGTPPFSSFPSIFNDIDLYTKRLVRAYIDKHGHPPNWMGVLSVADGYTDPGTLQWHDEKNDIMLRGILDELLHAEDRSRWFLLDYKTARYTAGQDRLLPLYKVQLLAYAFLLMKAGYKNPEISALIYFEPPESPTLKELGDCTKEGGFVLPLSAKVVKIDLEDFARIDDLLNKTRKIYDQTKAPEGREGCPDCKRLNTLIHQAKSDPHAGKELTDRYVRSNFGQWNHVRVWTDVAGDPVPEDSLEELTASL